MTYTSEVIEPAAPAPDRDKENYTLLWRQLGGERRSRIEQDWKIYHAAQEHIQSLRSLAAQFPQPSQLRKRLGYTLRPPAGWVLCGYCDGSGAGDIGYCRNCQGDGYIT